MKVLQICAAYKPAFIYGGPTMSVSMLCEQLVNENISIEVFTTTANGKSELDVIPNRQTTVDDVPVTYFKRTTKDHTHLSPSLIKTVWKEAPDFDLVHIHAWWNLVSIFSCLVALMRKVPVLISARGTLSPYSFRNKNISVKWFIHRQLGKRLLNRCHVLATSTREARAIAEVAHPKSITILPNFVKLPKQAIYAKNKPGEYFRLLFFSRIEEKKGLDILLDALIDVSVPYHLDIAGDGDKSYVADLKMIAAGNNIQHKISWLGFQNENKFDLMHQHDLLVLPSYDENFGNVVIESLSVGTPVLISEEVGLADYVQSNRLGWLCQSTPASVASMINSIAVNQKDELRRIRSDAPAIIYHDFNKENLIKRYINMYDKLINHDSL